MACVVTQVGEDLMVDLLDGGSPGLPAYGGWGTGAGTADKADEALFNEVDSRVAVTRSQPLSDKLRMVWTMPSPPVPRTITNAGVFTLVEAGTLFEHYDHTGIALEPGDTIEYTLECQVQ